jgi:hypothetical protein
VATYTSGSALVLTGFTGTAITVATTYTIGFCSYPLPTGVDGLEGRLTFPQSSTSGLESLEKVSEIEIRRRLARSSTPSRPQCYAETTKTFDPAVGSTRYVTFYPVPNSEYTLTAVGTLRPKMIDATNEYPLGGEVLAAVITESCLAAAEREMDDAEGVHCKNLPTLLEMAIQEDKDKASPDTIGVDRGHDRLRGHEHLHDPKILFNDFGGITGYI